MSLLLLFAGATQGAAAPTLTGVITVTGSYLLTLDLVGGYVTTVDIVGSYIPTIDVVGEVEN